MIFFIDLDGTLLDNNGKISAANLSALNKIKRNGGTVVIATGRNKFSTQKVLTDDLPIDYLIYSTGIVISDFKTGKILKNHFIDADTTSEIIKILRNLRLNFFVHLPAPENHHFYYSYQTKNSDFDARFKLYMQTSRRLPIEFDPFVASQFVIILPKNVELFNEILAELKRDFPYLSFVRATSPLDNVHIWLEIYPPKVSKGFAMAELCKMLDVDLRQTVAIGNDYNDLSMLEIAGYSFVTENAPDEIKPKFTVVSDNNSNAVDEVVRFFYR